MKIALIADTHLSDMENLPQDRALEWALEELKSIKPDVCLWLGDITACGSPAAAMRFSFKTGQLPFPSMAVPGNSDIRTASTAPVLENFLFTHREGLRVGEVLFVGINTSHDCIFPGERARLERISEKETLFLFSHQPPEYLDEDSRQFMKEWIQRRKAQGQKILLWACGHIHVYREKDFEGVMTVSVRALDPDKCSGGSPQIGIFDWDGQTFSKEERSWESGMPAAWSAAKRREFADFLGITCYKVERDMAFAIENGVRHLEWRSISDSTLPLLEKWRKGGGKSFSLHLPSVGLTDEQEVTGYDQVRSAVLDAVRADADMVTFHPPYVLNRFMQCEAGYFTALADAAAEALRPAAERNIPILVENNHTPFGLGNDTLQIQYGCTPVEQLGWRNALEERLGRGSCGLRLDIGHARNNMPLSQEYPIGKWYAMLGQHTSAYHLHQNISKPDGHMYNHHPITGWHDGFIAFDGFLEGWHSGMLNHGPMILEIREGDGCPAAETWKRIQAWMDDAETK